MYTIVWNLQEKLIKKYQPACKDLLTGYEKWLSNKKWFAGDNVSTLQLSNNDTLMYWYWLEHVRRDIMHLGGGYDNYKLQVVVLNICLEFLFILDHHRRVVLSGLNVIKKSTLNHPKHMRKHFTHCWYFISCSFLEQKRKGCDRFWDTDFLQFAQMDWFWDNRLSLGYPKWSTLRCRLSWFWDTDFL